MAIGFQQPMQRAWIDTGGTGATTTTTTTTDTWRQWSNTVSAWMSVSANDGTASSASWIVWNTRGTNPTTFTAGTAAQTITVAWGDWNSRYVREAETAEAKRARLEADRVRSERFRREQLAYAEVRRVAILKADKLLESILNSAQRDQLKKLGGFVIRGQSGQLYRIREGRSANVDVIAPDGKVTGRLCAYPQLNVPDGDTMAAQKLMLECDEHAFLQLAIKHSGHGAPVPAEVLHAYH